MSLWSRLAGTMASAFQIGGPTGPNAAPALSVPNLASLSAISPTTPATLSSGQMAFVTGVGSYQLDLASSAAIDGYRVVAVNGAGRWLLQLPASIANAAWQQPTWFIDPQNVQGTSSDGNSGLTSGTALRTWAGFIAKMGTVSPYLSVASVTVTFLSSHTDNTDPVVWSPFICNGCVPSIQGAVPAATAATFTRTATKSRAAGSNSLLSGTFSSGAPSTYAMVENTTSGKSSRAFVYAVGSPNTISQPLAKQSVPVTYNAAEVDTWNTGDTVNIYNSLIKVNLAVLEPRLIQPNVSFTNGLTLYQLEAWDPLGTAPGGGNSTLQINGNVWFQDCIVDKYTQVAPLTDNGNTFLAQNAFFVGSLNAYEGVAIRGGVVMGFNAMVPHDFGVLSADTILSQYANVSGMQLGFVYLDCALNVLGEVAIENNGGYGGVCWYGSAAVDVNLHETSNLALHQGTWAAALTYPKAISQGVVFNNARTASSISYAAGVGTINGPIATTVDKLDAPAGAAGFGGRAFTIGGASTGQF